MKFLQFQYKMTLQSTTDKRVIVKISLELLEEKKVKELKKRKWREKSWDENQRAHEILLQETGAFEKKDQCDLFEEIVLDEPLSMQICREDQDIRNESESRSIVPRYESPQTEIIDLTTSVEINFYFGKSKDEEVKDLMNLIINVWELCDRKKMGHRKENLAVRIRCYMSEIIISIARELADGVMKHLETILKENIADRCDLGTVEKTAARELPDNVMNHFKTILVEENIADRCDLRTTEKTAARELADNVMNHFKSILEEENLADRIRGCDKIEILLSSIKESASRELADNVMNHFETILKNKNIYIADRSDLLNIIKSAEKLADNVINNFKTILEEEKLGKVEILLPSIKISAVRELADNVMIHLKNILAKAVSSMNEESAKKIVSTHIVCGIKKCGFSSLWENSYFNIFSTDASESNSSKASESALVSSSCELQTTLDENPL